MTVAVGNLQSIATGGEWVDDGVPVLVKPTDLAITDDETGTSLTPEATVSDDTLLLRFYYALEYADDWIGYVERTGSGSEQITSLIQGQRYSIAACTVNADGDLFSEFTLPKIGSPTTSEILNTDERKHMSSWIRHRMRRTVKYTWYRKSVNENTIPSKMLNVPFAADPSEANIQYNENVRVSDQPGIFQSRGAIPVAKQRTRGFNKADLGFGDAKFGDFTAFCPIEYTVEIDDRLINTQNAQEYKVVHSTPHETGLVRHLELKWLK